MTTATATRTARPQSHRAARTAISLVVLGMATEFNAWTHTAEGIEIAYDGMEIRL